MKASKIVIVVILVVTIVMTSLTAIFFVQSTTTQVHLSGRGTYFSGALDMGVDIITPSSFYEGVPVNISCRIELLLPLGPMNVTVDSIEIGLYSTNEYGVAETNIASDKITYSPYLVFENVQNVTLQQEMTIQTYSSSPTTIMSCYLGLNIDNSTANYRLLGGPDVIESVPVIGWVLNPLFWVGVTATIWIITGLFLAKKRKAP